MNKNIKILLFLCALLSFPTPVSSDDGDFVGETSGDHGVGVLKLINNNTEQEVLLRFADNSFPPIKSRSSTDEFSEEDKPLKVAAVFGSMMLMGIVGMAAAKMNPQAKLQAMQARINKSANKYSAKVDAERSRLEKIDNGGETEEQDAVTAKDATIQARAAEEKKWTEQIKKQREIEDIEHEKKMKDPTISETDKIKLKTAAVDREKKRIEADEYNKKMGEAQKLSGISRTLWMDKQNTMNEWRNEKQGFSQEINQFKGAMGLNTAQDREADRAFYDALERMTPEEQKAAKAAREEQQRTREKTPVNKAEEKAKYWQSARQQGGFINKDANGVETNMTKGQMVKKVLWDRMLGQKKTTKENAADRKNKLTGMAKFAAKAAVIGAIPATLVALSDQIGDTPGNAMTSMIPWEIPDGKFRCPIDKNPLLLGFGTTLVQSFPEGGILQVKRMVGSGAAWLQNPLPTPLSFTMKFKVRTFDSGGVQIVLREGLDFKKTDDAKLDFDTKIMIGAFDNSVTAISDKGTIVAQIKKDQYPAAAVPPGLFTPYWLSYDKGLIMLGLGQPGNNVILTWHDPDFNEKVDHIGFSCDTAQIDYSEIFFSPAVTSVLSSKKYFFNDTEFKLAPTITWLSYPFREPGRGTFSFQKKGKGPAVISLALAPSEDAPQIRFPVGSRYDEPIMIRYKNSETNELVEEQIGVISDPYDNDENSLETYWVSNLYGQFTVGHSQPIVNASGQKYPPQPGMNMIACVTIPDLATAGTIGLATDPDTSDEAVSIKNITIHPAVDLQEDIPQGYVERRKFAGPLKVVYPFAYQFRQAGQSVEVHDSISGETWYPAKTPQQQATYFFNATIARDGTMSMKEIGKPKNPVQFGMTAGATALQQAAGLLNTTATQVGQSGVDPISQIITAAASIGLVGVATGINIAAGNLAAEAKHGFRDQNSYVYTEKVHADAKAITSLPPVVQSHKDQIDKLIANATQYKTSFMERFDAVKMELANAQMLAEGARQGRSKEDRHNEQLKFFELYVTSYKQIVKLINHPAIGSNAGMKKNIFEGLFFINQAATTIYTQKADLPQKQIVTDQVIQLLLNARQNPYLLNTRVSDDRNRSKLWSSWIQDLAGSMLTSVPGQSFTMNPMFGEYLWFDAPITLPLPMNGSLYFEAKGLGDIFVGIIDAPQEVRNSEKDVYEVVFGGNNNTKTFIRVKSLGRSVAEISSHENPNAAVTPMQSEKFWVSVKNGKISAGKGTWGEGKLVEWTDPYPMAQARFLGLSTWNSPVTFNSIRVGPAVEDLTPQLRDDILNKSTEKVVSAQAEEKTKLMQESFKDLEENDNLVNDDLTRNDFVKNDSLAFDMLMIPDLDELTHDVLQDNIDAAAGGDPRIRQAAAAAAKKAADAKKAENKDDKKDDKTAAAQKQQAAQMASGGLGGFFQEKFQLFGKKDENAPEKPGLIARFKQAVTRKKTTNSNASTQTGN